MWGAAAGGARVRGARLSVAWQVPQFALMTAAEVLYSITGLEFAYSGAPPALKSVTQSVWLLTDAVGNLLTVLVVGSISETLGLEQSAEFLLFAGGCVLALLWFWWLAQDVMRSSSVAHGGIEAARAGARSADEGPNKPAREDPRDADIDPLIN